MKAISYVFEYYYHIRSQHAESVRNECEKARLKAGNPSIEVIAGRIAVG
jgi:hypothetical protein